MTDTEKDLFKVIEIMVDETQNMVRTELDPGVKQYLQKLKERAGARDLEGVKALFSKQLATSAGA